MCHNGTYLCPLVESTFVAAPSKSMVVFKRYVGGLSRHQRNLQESGRQLALYGEQVPLIIPAEAWERRGEPAGSCENSHTRFVHCFQGGPSRRGRRMGTSPTVTAPTTSVILSTPSSHLADLLRAERTRPNVARLPAWLRPPRS